MIEEKNWFKTLFEEKEKYLHALARKLTRDEAVSQEMVSDAFMKVWERRDALMRGGKDVGGFLYTCVRNACIDHLRKQARNRMAPDDPGNLMDIEALVDLQSISTEVAMALRATVKKLPRQQYEVIRKLYLEEKHKTVVAEEMGISVHTVEVHREKGLKAMKKALQKINLKNWRDL